MTVWRNKLNSIRTDEGGGAVDWDEAKAYCRATSTMGAGWGRPEIPDGATLDEVLAVWGNFYDTFGNAPERLIRTIAEKVQDGDLVWTRDSLGRYWLGRIEGPWRYDASPDSRRLDLYNTRPCRWLPTPFRDYEVPGRVVTSFTGIGQTLRKIGDHPVAIRVSEMLWDLEANPDAPHDAVTPEDALTDLLDPTDVEDVVLLLLQHQGWILMPSSRMHDTPMYEAALRHRDDGRLAVVSVKSGGSNPVPIPELAAAAGSAEAYAYSTHGLFSVPPGQSGVVEITPAELVSFMGAHPELLPPRIARWLTP